MPELPEVEVSRLGITPHTQGQIISEIVIRQNQLRWTISDAIKQAVGKTILSIERRAKYLLLMIDNGTIVIHLGMSGSLRVLPTSTLPTKHDHVDLVMSNSTLLRYNDPRRFGAWLWYAKDEPIDVTVHLGPEPLSDEFNSDYVIAKVNKRRIAIKQLIMDNKVVVGVGNIYANEALYGSKINPLTPCNRLSQNQWQTLVKQIKLVLSAAIEQGGTTLNDFKQPDGKPGYFAQRLNVYGRADEECFGCGHPISQKLIGQRATFWCERCQPQIKE